MHDFVPFYFAPRSPMLYAINGGRVNGCNWRQSDIVHFETTVQAVTSQGEAFVFYDRNATLAFSTPCTDLSKLDDLVAWDLITEAPAARWMFANIGTTHNPIRDTWTEWKGVKRSFLVKDGVSLAKVTRLGVMDLRPQSRGECYPGSIRRTHLQVDVMRNWYF